MRIPLIAGNWKMNMSSDSALSLVKGIHYGLPFSGDVNVVVAPPFTSIESVASFLKDSYIGVAGQNLYYEDSGAYTGEISGSFLKNIGADFVIIGHSERRSYFHEDNNIINLKIKAALRNQLISIFCVGETLEERESGTLEEVIATQLIEGLSGIAHSDISKVVIAYEPVWAIGTGKTATPDEAQEVHSFIRAIIEKIYNSEIASKILILYGGSVNDKNSQSLMSQPDIDGALVGGASLKAEQFISIIKAASVKFQY
ncbi:triose-phosphate isomerase [bacterium]|nr:triose-phosphate isomerase [bacterium]